MSELAMVLAVSIVAALASPLGGLIAIWRKPTTMLMSLALGFAAGTLLGTIAFKMVPEALERSSLALGAAAIAAGFIAVYGFDLFVHRGRIAGPDAAQQPQVRRFHRRHPPRGDQVTVLAGGTSAEEVIEGLSIGVGSGIDPSLGILIGVAIVIDNIAEALGIGELIQGQGEEGKHAWRILGWTGLIGAALFGSALFGWFFLRGLPEPVLGALLAMGAGGMLYLTVTDLVPEGEQRHYQGSSALALGSGFLLALLLSRLVPPI
jgi:ZIP family zinc transporter